MSAATLAKLVKSWLTLVANSGTSTLRIKYLAHVKDASRVTTVGGASAVPAGGGSSLPFPGGFGHQPAGTMTGVRGARCNRGRCQAG
jgi:hypothetical protein